MQQSRLDDARGQNRKPKNLPLYCSVLPVPPQSRVVLHNLTPQLETQLNAPNRDAKTRSSISIHLLLYKLEGSSKLLRPTRFARCLENGQVTSKSRLLSDHSANAL